jgi:hypothetical protein
MGKSSGDRDDAKLEKKRAKAELKTEKARQSAAVDQARIQGAAGRAETSRSRLPDGVGVTVHKRNGRSDLVVTGLSDPQLARVLPEINKEVLIAVTADHNALRAGLMRFVREGLFQTIIKVVAGLIVGLLLLRLGLS